MLAFFTSADTILPALEGFERRIARAPLGVVFCLPAWNYPLLTAVNVVVPAILAGNSVVLKHSPRSPLCGEHFARAEVAEPAFDGSRDGGFGLFLVDQCVDATTYEQRPDGVTAVRLVKRLGLQGHG